MTQKSGLDDEDFHSHNRQSLKKLARAIVMSQSQFALILVCCDTSPQPRQIVNELQALCALPIQGIILHSAVDTLLSTILSTLENPPPSALVVFGLESLVAIDRVLSATNLVRDEFRKQFSFPLVLWIDDEILQKLIRLAPDFKSWAANPIRLEIPDNRSIECKFAALAV